jgi:plasmid replication initiation protein
MSKSFDITVRQANDFIESCYQQEYTEQELKAVEFIISQCRKSDYELVKENKSKHIEISALDFAKLINAHPDQIYRNASVLSHGLMNKKVHFKYISSNGKPAFETLPFFSRMKYDNGLISIDINPFILPYFIEVCERFTEINLRFLVNIGSSYGIKLYKLLKQYQKIGDRTFTVNELRDQFGINVGKYKLYANFKIRVLEIAKKHINQHTDILIEYDEIKLSRKINKIKFYIRTKITQFKQAQLAFLNWVDSKPSTASLKSIIGDLQKNKKDIFENNYVNEQFGWYLSNKIYNYDPNSCEPLQHYEPDTLFGND